MLCSCVHYKKLMHTSNQEEERNLSNSWVSETETKKRTCMDVGMLVPALWFLPWQQSLYGASASFGFAPGGYEGLLQGAWPT